MEKPEILIREVETIEEMRECIELQRKVFASPDMEISPVRHLIVARYAGGFTLGAYYGERLVGFVLSLPMFLAQLKPAFYSHMTAVDTSLQSLGIGAKMKWAQRERALAEGVRYIKWTYQPVLARNAFFNIERLGVTINTYMPNFYGTDAEASAEQKTAREGVDSDRLFADWHLDSPKVVALSKGEKFEETGEPAQKIEIPPDWNDLVVRDTKRAIDEQERIKHEFQDAFSKGLIVRGFERSDTNPKYLLYRE
jgi:predicted GNAT superfamily acetyltransferase